jgi:hypothetical protein
LTPRIDGDRLDGILNGSSEHTFKLRRQTVSAQGARKSYDIELVQLGLKKATIADVLKVLVSMSERKSKAVGTPKDRRKSAAADVLSLVDASVSGVEFTDAELSFSENGKTQRVNAETIDELFVYPVGSKRLTVLELRSKSATILQRIAPTLGIQANLSVAGE